MTSRTRTSRGRRRSLALVGLLLATTACRDAPVAPSGDATGAGETTTVPASTDSITSSPAGSTESSAPLTLDLTQHPRLWITSADLPRLRSWARADNPLWADGLARVVQQVRTRVDGNAAADDGSPGWVEDPVEADAEVLAFASLVEPDEAARQQDRQQARRLLLRGLGAAAAGPQAGSPYRDPSFAIDDRSRWWGEGWALTVDWIYPSLTAGDRALVRQVFLRWTDEEIRGGQTTDDHPEPAGAHDPSLVQDPTRVAWAANNYFTAHGRNIALMALALDPGDDTDGRLRGRLTNAVDGFVAMSDAMLRTSGRGGAPPEGLEYGPQSFGYIAQTLLALHTSGADAMAPAVTRFDADPVWDAITPWLAATLSPAPVAASDGTTRWLPATYGDSQTYHNPDWIQLLAPLAVYDARPGGSTARLDAERWFELTTVGAGPSDLTERAGNPANPTDAILYYLMFDPTAPPPGDPRASLPTFTVADGAGRVSARTGWDASARWLTMAAGRAQIDHQEGDGLDIGFFRKGEWLTKARTGYDVATSDQKNTLAIEGLRPEHDEPDDYRHVAWAHGSQYPYVNDGPGRLVATSTTPTYTYVAADATSLYDSASEGVDDVTQATRAVLWLSPDVVVVYDRATTRRPGGFKRFDLQLAGRVAQDDVGDAVTTTAAGQHLAIRTLLPAGARGTEASVKIDGDGRVEDEGQLAAGETMTHRFTVEAPGHPADVRFLHVLQGYDAGATAQPTALATSSGAVGDRFDGAVAGDALVLFPHDADHHGSLDVDVPAGVTHVFVTGLAADGGYAATVVGRHLTLHEGGAARADHGGVATIDLAAVGAQP